MEREKSPSLLSPAGLLPSDEFEASFGDDKVYGGDDDSHTVSHDVRTSVEHPPPPAAENHSAISQNTTANATSHILSPMNDTIAYRVHIL
jgi:hypothetical protein